MPGGESSAVGQSSTGWYRPHGGRGGRMHGHGEMGRDPLSVDVELSAPEELCDFDASSHAGGCGLVEYASSALPTSLTVALR
jgi:hypothetical protein